MGFDRYRERGVSHGVKDSYDFTDHEYAGGIVRSSSLVFLTTLVGIHIDEHDWIGSTQDSHGNIGWVQIHVLVDPCERAVRGRALDEHGVMHVN